MEPLPRGSRAILTTQRVRVALPHFTQAAHLNPRNPQAWLIVGICHLRLNRFEQALHALAQSEQIAPTASSSTSPPATPSSTARTTAAPPRPIPAPTHSGAIEAKRGACEVHFGQTTQGLQRVEHALQREPTFAELFDVASATALLAGNLPLAPRIAVKRTALARTTDFHFTFAAALSESTGDPNRALLQQGLAHFPANTAPQQAILECPRDPTPPC